MENEQNEWDSTPFLPLSVSYRCVPVPPKVGMGEMVLSIFASQEIVVQV